MKPFIRLTKLFRYFMTDYLTQLHLISFSSLSSAVHSNALHSLPLPLTLHSQKCPLLVTSHPLPSLFTLPIHKNRIELYTLELELDLLKVRPSFRSPPTTIIQHRIVNSSILLFHEFRLKRETASRRLTYQYSFH